MKDRRFNLRVPFFAAIAGIVTAFCYVAGARVDTYDTLDLLDKKFYISWLLVSVLAGVVIVIVWEVFHRLSESSRWTKVGRLQLLINEWIAGNTKKAGVICVVGLLLCWLPALLSLYPGAFSYDAYDEWMQVHQGALTAHHPVVHVLLAGGFAEMAFAWFGDYNIGIAAYSLLQMTLLAIVFGGGIIRFLRSIGVSLWWRVGIWLFYACSPVSQLFSICTTKDVFFTAAELLFWLGILRFCIEPERMKERKQMILFGLIAFCTVIFRNNGLYIVLFTLLFLAVLYRKTIWKYKKNVCLFLAVLCIPYIIYTGPVYKILHVEQGGVEEMLSVPLQQMARVYKYDYASIPLEDEALLLQYVDKASLESYRPTVSDFVKRGFDGEAFEKDKVSFFMLWLKLGIKHPLTYINSFLINTVDAWYPGAVIDGYRHGDGRSSWFDYKVAPPGEEKVYLEGLHEYYESISHDLEVQKKPLTFFFMSPGWYFLCTLILFLYFWCYKKYHLMPPFLVLLFHIGTVLLGPMMLVRYMLIFFFVLPILIAMAICNRQFADQRG